MIPENPPHSQEKPASVEAEAYTIEDIELNSEPLLFAEPWKKTADDWLQILTAIEFQGNPYNAAGYLVHFSRGMFLILDKLQKKGLKIPQIPQLAIVNSTVPSLAFNGTRQEGEKFTRVNYIKKSTLELMSRFKEDEVFGMSQNGENLFQGKMSTLARNAGIEEAHHAVFNQFKGSSKYTDALKSTQADYDADSAEFRALLQQISISKSEKDYDQTIQVLQNRADAAAKVRRQN